MRIIPIFFLVSILLLSSCGGRKSTLAESDLKTETLKAIIKSNEQTKPDFKTMRGRLKGVYDDGRDKQGINISYRFQKDETLWMSARLAGLFEVAKMMITPNNIKFYERLDNSYFDGDFKLISDFLGIELNYSQVENLLLGQAVKPILLKQTDLHKTKDYYQLDTSYENGVFQSLIIDAKAFNIKEQTLIKDDKKVKIVYTAYQIIDKTVFPKEMVIMSGNGDDLTSISLVYKNIKLNDQLDFPFRMPSNFSTIKLN